MTDYERGFRAGVEAAAKAIERQEWVEPNIQAAYARVVRALAPERAERGERCAVGHPLTTTVYCSTCNPPERAERGEGDWSEIHAGPLGAGQRQPAPPASVEDERDWVHPACRNGHTFDPAWCGGAYCRACGLAAPPASGAPCRECGGTGDAAFDGDKMCNRCAGSGKHGTGGATP
jgi:hypothetical protein